MLQAEEEFFRRDLLPPITVTEQEGFKGKSRFPDSSGELF